MANIANTDKNTSWEDSWRKYDTNVIAQDIPFDMSASEKLKVVLNLMDQRIKFAPDNIDKNDLISKFADFKAIAESVSDEMSKMTPEEKSGVMTATVTRYEAPMSLRNRLRRLYVTLDNTDTLMSAVCCTAFEFRTYHDKQEWGEFFAIASSLLADGIYIPLYAVLDSNTKLEIIRRVVENYICAHKQDSGFPYRSAAYAKDVLWQLYNENEFPVSGLLAVGEALRTAVFRVLGKEQSLVDTIFDLVGVLRGNPDECSAADLVAGFMQLVGMDLKGVTKSEKKSGEKKSSEDISFGRAADYPTSDEIADGHFQYSEIGKMIKPVQRASKNILKYMDSIFLGENDNNDYAIKTEYYRLKALAENTSSELRKLYDALHDAEAREEFVPMEEILWCLKHFCHIGNSEMLRKEAESVDHALLMHTAFESLAKEFYCFRCIAQDTRSGFFDKRYGEILFNRLGTGVTVHKK